MPRIMLYWGDNGEQKQKFTILSGNNVMEKYKIRYDFLRDKSDLIIETKVGFSTHTQQLRSKG